MGNEVWNFATPLGLYAWGRELAHNTASYTQYDWSNWLGRTTALAGRALDAAYGNDRTKYLFGPGVQSISFKGSAYPPDADPSGNLMLSPHLVSERNDATYAAKNWVNAAYISSYWRTTSWGLPAELPLANQWMAATGSDKAAKIQAYADDNEVHSGQLLLSFTNFKAWCLHFGVTTSLIYEGALDLVDLDTWGGETTFTSASGTAGQSTIAVNSTAGLQVGMMYKGGKHGIAKGTASNNVSYNAYITAINSSTSLTLSSPNTGTVVNVDTDGRPLTFASPTVAFHFAAKVVPTMRQWEALNIYQARAAGMKRPSMFILGGNGFTWSLLEPDVYANDNTSPRWLGTVDAGNAGPKLFLRMQ